jgi:hypothetical protein
MKEERLKFAERFSELAAQLGYEGHGRQTRLAAYYGKKQPSVKKWFDGDAQPDYEICADMCRRARVHYEWLMTGRGPKCIEDKAEEKQTPKLSLVYVDEAELAVITAYRESTELGRASIEAAASSADRAERVDVFTARNKS